MTAVILDTTVLDRIARNLNKNTKTVGLEIAYQVEAEAKKLAPYITGALQNSIYVATPDHNSPPVAKGGVDQVPLPTPTGKTIANVGPCVEYARRIEFGFHGQDVLGRTYHQAGKPYLIPAFEMVVHRYEGGEKWKAIVEK